MAKRSTANISGTPAWLVWSGIGLGILLVLYLTFEFGRIQAGYSMTDAMHERDALSQQIAALETTIEAQKEQIALLQTHRDIDKAAYRDVEASLGKLQRKIQEQREAIAFYRGIISPADGGRGLRVQDLKLAKGSEEGRYSLRLVLVQVKQHDRSVKGEVDVTFDGEQDGVAKTYTLAELMPASENSKWPFSFRYFQNFDRDLLLPTGFQPERINIEVKSRTKSVASLKQSFPWESSRS
ncbi:MAG: hypothetical protein HKN35_11995 [Woeseia sp.]|nr:hypothetical protein [Woeseia sp.]MBT8096913.1 hypothetical protein [Woeseia sp.]NNE61611.1 hypothetical protein [Woeseia sp.]NNL55468.1 hypothetical protein [Woeseia sp.]